MTRFDPFVKMRNVVRTLAHRALGSSAVLANEFFHAGVDFSILNRDSSSRDEVLYDRRRGAAQRAPVVLVPAGQVKNLEFLNVRSREAFLRGDIVEVPANRGGNVDPQEYARHWTNRFRQRNIAALVPNTAHMLFGAPTQTGRFELGRYPQALVHQGLLDTELFNAAADVRNDGSPVIVYCVTFANFGPGFMRLFTLSAHDLVVQP